MYSQGLMVYTTYVVTVFFPSLTLVFTGVDCSYLPTANTSEAEDDVTTAGTTNVTVF
jgi:hypothetical protein